ncbi:MAG TPA: hypothetical protein VGN07_11435 [Steroidobacteraceae bacterium]
MKATLLFALLALAPLGIAIAGESSSEELQAKCEEAREARLKPLRDAEIAKCKAERGRDPEYCERYWKDHGDATRLPNGNMKARLFDDLPECVAAWKAKQGEVK